MTALARFESLPPATIAFRVPDQAASSELQAGDFAVVDQAARDIAIGKLYLLQWSSRLRCEQPRIICTILKVTAEHMRLQAYVRKKVVGCIVGVLARDQ